MSLFEELKRRNVIRVSLAYLVLCWLLLQVGDVLFEALRLPEWSNTMLVAFLGLGLLPVVLFSWAFEITTEGIKREADVDRTGSITGESGQRLNIMIVVLLIGAMGLFAFDHFYPGAPGSTSDVTRPATERGLAGGDQGQEGSSSAMEKPVERSIAVLPFANLSSDPENEYFADGLTEEILNVIAQVRDLQVAGRTSSFAFKGRNEDLREIGQTLGVAHILEGSVRRQGERVRVTAQLIRGSDGIHLWSESYDRTLEDVFAIQDDIAGNVARALQVVLDADARARMESAGVRNVQAFVAYQKGREQLDLAHSGGPFWVALDAADALFAEAIEAAPDFADAWYERSDVYAHYTLGGPRDRRAAALAEYRRAMDEAWEHARDPLRRAFIDVDRVLFSDNWIGLRERIEKAVAADGCPEPTWIEVASMLGYAQAMRDMWQRKMLCDPLQSYAYSETALNTALVGNLEAALRQIEAAREQFRGNQLLAASNQLLLLGAGRVDEARALTAEIDLQTRYFGILSAVLPDAMAGDLAAATSALEANVGPDTERSSLLCILAAIGDRDGANDLAAKIDAEPAGAINLMTGTYTCGCGELFDLAATPNFAARLREARIDWDPPGLRSYPAKDW